MMKQRHKTFNSFYGYRGKNKKTKINLDAMTKGWNGDFSLTSFHRLSNINEKQNKLQP
jgi:hypothetical protein